MNLKRRDIPQLNAVGDESAAHNGGRFSLGRFEENMRADPRRAETHRHTFHELMVFESGEGTYSGDFVEYKIAAPAAVIVPAGTVHWWPAAKDLRGWVCGFDLEFLRAVNRTDEVIASLLAPKLPNVVLTTDAMERMQPWLRRLQQEWWGHALGKREMLRCCLTAALVEVSREHGLEDGPKSASQRLYFAFLEVLESRVMTMPSARDLAEILRVTPDHLSASLRMCTGKNTGELIAERIILKSKRLLAHTRLGVAEAAYALGFESPSYFARFFRRHAGVAPKEFRAEAT